MTGEDEGGVVFNLCVNEDDFCYGVFFWFCIILYSYILGLFIWIVFFKAHFKHMNSTVKTVREHINTQSHGSFLRF